MARRRRGKLITSSIWIVVGGGLIAGAGFLAMRPADVDACVSRAVAAADVGRYDVALHEYDDALVQLPRDRADFRPRRAQLLRERGDLNLVLRRPEHARSDYEEAQTLAASDWVAWDRVGRAFLALEEFDKAALQFESAAQAFPDRARWFRHAAGGAHYRVARLLLEAAESEIEARALPGRRVPLVHALERFASTAVAPPDRARIERELLDPAISPSLCESAFTKLLAARGHFERADAALADYDTAPELDLGYGVVRSEMHLQAGRYYELRRLVDLLLQLPEARTSEYLPRLQATLANALDEIGLTGEASDAFLALRQTQAARAAAERNDTEAKLLGEAATRSWLLAIEARLKTRQGKAAQRLLGNAAAPTPTNLLLHFFLGYSDWLNGEKERAIPMLEKAAQIFLQFNGRHSQLRTPEQWRFVVEGLIEALAACDRPETAAQLIEFALQGSPAPAALLAKRIELLRPLRDRIDSVVADGFRLLAYDRAGGRNLEAWEKDWLRAQPKNPPIAAVVADQADRIRRVFRTGDSGINPAVQQLALMALGNRKRKELPAGALKGAANVLLGDLQGSPGLVVQIYRKLIASGDRTQGYLLLYGLVAAHPEVADFRLLLARHELSDGRLADAAQSLQVLHETLPDDAEIALLTLRVARQQGDEEGTRALEREALAAGPTPQARLISATNAVERGQLAIAVTAAAGSDPTTPTGRALAGIAALAHARAGDDAAAEALAAPVLAADATQAQALEAMLVVMARRTDEEGRNACDAEVARRAAELGTLDQETLTVLATAARDAGAWAATETLARAVLASTPQDAACELLLADALLGQGRWDDVAALLDKGRPGPAQLERTRRAALAHAARDGAAAAWEWLRERVVAGEPEQELARWLALVGGAAGRAQPALDVLHRSPQPLDEDDERFLALCVAAFDTPLSDREPLTAVAERVTKLRGHAPDADRELARWISLELSTPAHAFLAELCEILLLRDLPELAVLRESRERQLESRYAAIGSLARARAVEHEQRGRDADAIALLVAQLKGDRADVETMRALLPWLPRLDAETLRFAAESPAAAGLGQAERTLLAAELSARADENGEGVAKAQELLLVASSDPATRALALLALAESDDPKSPLPVGLPRAPWCEAADALHAAAAGGRDRDVVLGEAIVAIAHDESCDAVTRERLARRLEKVRAAFPEARAKELALALVAKPGPWFSAYQAVAADLATRTPDREAVVQVGTSLELALLAIGDGTAPFAALDALAWLARAARRAGDPEMAAAWLARVARDCPIHPIYLEERGLAAVATGDLFLADNCFSLSVAFGNKSPDAQLFLAERQLLVHGRPREARDLATAALAAAAAPELAALRARAHEVLARCHCLLGAQPKAEAEWIAASRERGEDPSRSLPIALERFGHAPASAVDRLKPLAEEEGPNQELARRLLPIAAAAPKGEPAPK